MKNGRFQAKDIDDRFFLELVDYLSMQREYPWNPPSQWTIPWGNFPHWVMRMDLDYVMPVFPWQVILAKASQLMKRKLLGGCDCGCRGDFELTEKGKEYLRQFGPLHADAQSPTRPARDFNVIVDRAIAEARRMRLGPPLIPPEGVRAVLLETSDPSRLNLVFVKEENN